MAEECHICEPSEKSFLNYKSPDMKLISKNLDSLIYMFVGPFAVLYIFPQFFLNLERRWLPPIHISPIIDRFAQLLMYGGAFIAIWCAIIMWTTKKGSPNAFSMPTCLVCNGPYRLVRHPMMWSLFFTLAGEVIHFASPLLLVWLLIWIRVSIIYIKKYEEPYLISVFSEEYLEYCKKTPRWIPSLK